MTVPKMNTKTVGGMKSKKTMGGMKSKKTMGGMKSKKIMGGMASKKIMGGKKNKSKRKSSKKGKRKSRPTIRNLVNEMKGMFKGGSSTSEHGVATYGNMGGQTSVDGTSNAIRTMPPLQGAGMAPPVEIKGGRCGVKSTVSV